MKPEIVDLLENLKQVSEALTSIAHTKSRKDLDNDEFEDLHKEEFRLSMEESRLIRKLEKIVSDIEKDPAQKFYANRVKKTIEALK